MPGDEVMYDWNEMNDEYFSWKWRRKGNRDWSMTCTKIPRPWVI